MTIDGKMVLPGFENLFKPVYEWQPLPHVLDKVKNYFSGYLAKGREIFGKRKYIAARLGMDVRTLARYIAYLGEQGWLKTVKRTARTAYRKVFPDQPAVPSAVPSQATAPLNDVTSEETPTEAREKPMSETRMALPVGYGEQFQTYIGVFISAGKALNRIDIARAHATWTGMEQEDRDAAVLDALKVCKTTRYQRFMPLPCNHLAGQGWNRLAVKRTLEFEDPRLQEKRDAMEELTEGDGFIGDMFRRLRARQGAV